MGWTRRKECKEGFQKIIKEALGNVGTKRDINGVELGQGGRAAKGKEEIPIKSAMVVQGIRESGRTQVGGKGLGLGL